MKYKTTLPIEKYKNMGKYFLHPLLNIKTSRRRINLLPERERERERKREGERERERTKIRKGRPE